MEQELIEKLEKARRDTGGAISTVAQAKYELEKVRKDVVAPPEKIQQAAQSYRQAEHVMQEMIKKEIATIIEVATGSSLLPDHPPA